MLPCGERCGAQQGQSIDSSQSSETGRTGTPAGNASAQQSELWAGGSAIYLFRQLFSRLVHVLAKDGLERLRGAVGELESRRQLHELDDGQVPPLEERREEDIEIPGGREEVGIRVTAEAIDGGPVCARIVRTDPLHSAPRKPAHRRSVCATQYARSWEQSGLRKVCFLVESDGNVRSKR